MNIKKFMLRIIIILSLLPLLVLTAFAIESNVDQYNEEFDFESLLSELDDETLSILNEIGIEEFSLEGLFSVSPAKVLDALFSVVSQSVKAPVSFLTTAMGILLVTSLMTSFLESHTINLVGGATLGLCTAVPVAGVVTSSFSVLQVLNGFTTAFTALFCAIVSSMGKVTTAITYASLTVFSDTVFSSLLSGVSQPVVNGMCALAFLSCFDMGGFTEKLSGIIKKLYVFALSFIGTVFSGIVTLKGVLSDGADTLSARSIRLVVGNSLPVVGGTVSETYSTLISSLSLIKNTVGVFGIITVAVTVLPTLLRLVAWILALDIASVFADISGAASAFRLFPVLKDALVLLVATITIVSTVFIVSVGVVIAVKGGSL